MKSSHYVVMVHNYITLIGMMGHSRHMPGPTVGKQNSLGNGSTPPEGHRAGSTWGCNPGTGPTLPQTAVSISLTTSLKPS